MHDFLDHAGTLVVRPRRKVRSFSRPDTYGAAAALIGVSRTHAFAIIHGTRETTPTKRRIILSWARDLAKQGRGDAPAVVAALHTLAA